MRKAGWLVIVLNFEFLVDMGKTIHKFCYLLSIICLLFICGQCFGAGGPNLVAQYKMDNGPNTTVLDSIDPNHNGTLISSLPLPTDFPVSVDGNIVKFYRNTDGSRGPNTTTILTDSYITSLNSGRTIDVNILTGSDTTGTGATAAPFKTLTKAFVALNADANFSVFTIRFITGNVNILCGRDTFKAASGAATLSSKTVIITPDDCNRYIYASTAETTPTWVLTPDQTYTYECNRTSTRNVVDYNTRDSYGIPLMYIKKTSVATVEADANGSWWTDGTKAYVHAVDNAIPQNSNHLVLLNLDQLNVKLTNSSQIVIRNVRFIGYNNVIFTADATANKFVAFNCISAYQNTYHSIDAWQMLNVKNVYEVNCLAVQAGTDGFNQHYTAIDANACLAVQVNCKAWNCGLFTEANNENAFTSHDGGNTLLVDCEGYNTNGPVAAFVNSSYLVAYDCNMGATYKIAGAGAASWYVESDTNTYLFHCIGSDDLNGLSSDGSCPIAIVNDFTGIINPTAALDVTYPAYQTPAIDGQIGGALEFDGVSDYVDTNQTFQSTFQNSFTVSVWVKPDDGQPTDYTGIIYTADTITMCGFGIQLQADGGVNAFVDVAASEFCVVTISPVFSDGVQDWTMLTAVVSVASDDIKIYANGVLRGTGENIFDVVLANYVSSARLVLACEHGDNADYRDFFSGSLDDVRIYSGALTAVQIKSLYLYNDILHTFPKGGFNWGWLGME